MKRMKSTKNGICNLRKIAILNYPSNVVCCNKWDLWIAFSNEKKDKDK